MSERQYLSSGAWGQVLGGGQPDGHLACGRCQALAAARLHEPETEFRPLAVQPQHLMPAFSLDSRPSRRGSTYRGRAVDRLLEHLGIGR